MNRSHKGTGWVGIPVGDVTGIGPEVALKAAAMEAAQDAVKYLFIGDETWLNRQNVRTGLKLPLQPFVGYAAEGRFFIHDPLGNTLPDQLTIAAPEAALAAVEWLRDGAVRCLKGELDAIVTAPVNKESIIRAGHNGFVGQTEMLSQLAGTQKTAMMLLGQDERGRWLRVALATVHMALRCVPENLTRERVFLTIERAVQSCSDLGLSQARIAVAGLNPHAGEGGEFGDEETTVIGPAVEDARKRGWDVEGALSGDTVFHHALHGRYDVVVAMYHDQGLAPLKAVAFDTGVNWTLGLPFIRTSPDHGTAYNLAGHDKANPSSMRAAIRLAKLLAAKKAN